MRRDRRTVKGTAEEPACVPSHRTAVPLLVSGATGALGRRLLSRIQGVRVLSRSPERAARDLGVEAVRFDLDTPLAAHALEGVDAIVHLAGEPVAERWTDEKKRKIRDSRVIGTRRIVEAIANASSRPRVLVSASAVGIYGSRGDEELDESSAPGEGFLADVCRAWEAEAIAAEKLGVRVVRLRIGVVLAKGEGMLGRLVPLFRKGVGGRVGDGKQWLPWIAVDDIVGLIQHAIANERVTGAMNACAPNPVTNATFTKSLAHALHRPAILPAPVAALRLAFGEMSEVILASQRVLPRVAQETGYAFAYPNLDEALAHSV